MKLSEFLKEVGCQETNISRFDTEKGAMSSVKQSGYALQYVKEQTPEICLAAVTQTGFALKYVDKQTPKICLAAVKQSGYALQYVMKQTPEICLAAVKQDRNTIRYVDQNIFKSERDITTELDIPIFGLTNKTLYINLPNKIITDKPQVTQETKYTTLPKYTTVKRTANDWKYKKIIIPNEFVDKLLNKTGTITEDLFMIVESPSDNEDYAIINEEEKVAMMPYQIANKGDMVFWDYSLKDWIHDQEELYTSIPPKYILPDRKLGVVKEDLFIILSQNDIKQLTQIIVLKGSV